MADAIPVAVIGGGAYAARLVELVAAAGLPPLELRLCARDRERLDAIAAHAAARVAGGQVAVRACGELDDAIAGAAVVVLLIRVGGLAARAHDESFPARFGLVGDEGVGVGGMANAWRTLPVLDGIAARLATRAPAARVLNLMAPLGVTTRLLVDHGLDAVGLCELPAATLARWTAAVGPAPPLAYAGLNHLGFFWAPGQAPLEHPVLRAAVDAGAAPASLVERLGAAPLHYYVEVFEPEAARQVGRARRPGRAEELAGLSQEILDQFRQAPGAPAPALARRPTPWFDDALVPALAAVLGGPAYQGPLDLPAGGLLDETPLAVVVELFGRIDGGGASFDPVPARPAPVRAILSRLAAAEDLLYRAATQRDPWLLADALDALPLAWDGSSREKAELLDEVVAPISEWRAP